MKANRRIHGTLYTLPKQPLTVDGVTGSQQDKTCWPNGVNEQHETINNVC